jgi:hypothetical protein
MAQWIKKMADDADSKDDKTPIIEIKPEMIREAMKEDMDSIKSSSKAMMDYIAEQKAERQAAQEAEANKARQENNKVDDIDFLTDPEAAINKKLRPIAESNAVMASMFVRREVLENMEYYDDPEFKKRVDTMIDQQPLNARLDRAVIMNAYKVTRFDAIKDIEDGKIKSSLSVGGGNRGSRRDDKGGGEDESTTMTQAEKHYASRLGITEKDWQKQKKEMEYV